MNSMIKMKNIELEDFILFLDEFDLVGAASRMRTRFKNLLKEYNTRFNNERIEIVNRYATKDEHGNVITKIENGVEIAKDIIDKDSLNREFQELCLEEVIIEATEERRQMLMTVREIILNCQIPRKGKSADLYSFYCDLMENIHYGEVV